MNPPRVYEVTKPNNHKINRTTAMVWSMTDPFRQDGNTGGARDPGK